VATIVALNIAVTSVDATSVKQRDFQLSTSKAGSWHGVATNTASQPASQPRARRGFIYAAYKVSIGKRERARRGAARRVEGRRGEAPISRQ